MSPASNHPFKQDKDIETFIAMPPEGAIDELRARQIDRSFLFKRSLGKLLLSPAFEDGCSLRLKSSRFSAETVLFCHFATQFTS
jgi:hypothetical protein